MHHQKLNHISAALKQLTLIAIISSLGGLLPQASQAEQAIQVWVTLLPQIDLVEQVGGDAVKVHALVSPGESPGSYIPQPRELTQLAKADLFFGIGVPTEQNVLNRMETLLSQVRFIPASEWLAPESEAASAAKAESAEGHNHDPHCWMDPIQMLAFVDCVRAELTTLRPDMGETFAQRAAELKKELTIIDSEIRQELAPYRGRHFYINHPSLGHFAARYGLVQKSLEIKGSSPSAARIARMVAQARKEDVQAILTQPQFNRSSADVLARALDCPTRIVDPLAPDYRANLRRVSHTLVSAF
jgi:zinc transport system substrate-binding protein